MIEAARSTERLLIHTPFGRDASLIRGVLSRSGIDGRICPVFADLVSGIAQGAEGAIVGDEALRTEAVAGLNAVLRAQPPWSDFPLLIMTSGGRETEASRRRLQLLEPLGNVTLLERPFRTVTLVSSVRAMLRARRHQYQIRDDIAQRQEQEELLRGSEARYRTLAEALPQLVWTCLPDGACDYLSSQWVAYTGIPEAQQLGLKWLDLVMHAEDRERTYRAWMAAVEDKAPYDLEYRLRGADGTYRWFKTRGTPVRNPDGQIVKWFGTCTDIHDQRAAEEELRRVNRELEEFAYVASHDLQEPLRMVNIYSRLIVKQADGASSKLTEYADFVQQGVARMETLLRDLLTFSRTVQNVEPATGEADLSAALSEALSVLKNRIEEEGAVVQTQALPTVRGDTAQISHVFQNLLANSLKYRIRKLTPRICVSASRNGDGWVVAVKDNGIGFEQQYAQRIFGLFKRLHKDEYPGTGLGLAICERIVTRYGGRIWAESAPGEGAAFYFSLPALDA